MRIMLRAAALAVAVLAAPASAEAVGDRVMATLSARLFPLLDAAGHDPAALERIAKAPGMESVLRVRRERRAAWGTDLVCRAQALFWSDPEPAALRRAVVQAPGLPAAD